MVKIDTDNVYSFRPQNKLQCGDAGSPLPRLAATEADYSVAAVAVKLR